MATFILVPGMWLGGWAWRHVAKAQRAAGHTIHPASWRTRFSPERFRLELTNARQLLRIPIQSLSGGIAFLWQAPSTALGLDLTVSWDVALSMVAASDLTKRGSRCTIGAPWTFPTNYIGSARLHVQGPKVGIGQPFGYAMPNLFSIGNLVDRPKWLGLLDR